MLPVSTVANSHLQMPTTIVTVADSRGRGLGDFLRHGVEHMHDITIQDSSRGGANYDQLTETAKALTKNAIRANPSHRVILVLFGGICSFTQVTRRGSESEITYERDETRVASLKRKLDDLYDFCKSKGFYLLSTSIIPASLQKAQDHYIQTRRLSVPHLPDIESRQSDLEADIAEFNSYVKIKAESESCAHVNLHKEIQKNAIKGKRKHCKRRVTTTDYAKLTDGVHPTEDLKIQLSSKIQQACLFLINDTDWDTEASTQSETEPDTWQFKRRKVLL